MLQAAVVCLGFGMNLKEVVHAGASGFMYTAISITFALSFGVLLGKMLQVGKTQSLLISFGTAICGGSAIAAMGPVLQANDEEMAVSLGTVFVLNSVALLLFPAIGHLMNFSQTQFGLWAALAIHDTSSVVGASAKYGATALAVGTTVKLARALWIVPLAIATAMLKKSKAKVNWPWFILYFCVAAVLASYVPHYLPQSVGRVFRAEPAGAGGVDGGAVSDWDGDYAEHVEGGRDAAAGAGGGVVDRGGERVAVGDPRGMDCVVANAAEWDSSSVCVGSRGLGASGCLVKSIQRLDGSTGRWLRRGLMLEEREGWRRCS